MDAIDDLLKDACEDQRAALKRYHETGSEADAARIHYESCLSCERAFDALAFHRVGQPVLLPPVVIQGNRPGVVAFYLGTWAAILGAVGFLGYLLISAVMAGREASVSEAEGMEARVRYVRMPGRPEICIAALPGVGGYGPTFLGAAPCDAVSDRYASDEEIAWSLREYVVVRVRGTDQCLAHAHDASNSFTFPCGPGPDD